MSVPVDEPVVDPAAKERLELAWRWLNEFPVNPHPELGRSGPVCPYMGRALQRRVVRLFPFDATRGDAALATRARELRQEFLRRCREQADDRSHLVFFIIPFGRDEPALKALVERVHAQLRPEFVSGGMLAGDFWPHHETPGLHSGAFRPFASPLPILGMRNMVPGDLAFFAAPETPAEVRLTYLGYYRDHFGDTLSEYWAQRLTEAERDARAALSAR